jgi:uncharacterized membrane protein YccC
MTPPPFGLVMHRVWFGIRLCAAVSASLYIALSLQLNNPYWSSVTAVIVLQQGLGSSLRKGVFRFIGTAVGAVVVVGLASFSLQDGAAFMVGLAFWGGACGFLATILGGQSSYAAALAGYTTVIIVGNALGPSGQVTGDVFALATTRSSEIWIGIVAATVVSLGSVAGRAREEFLGGLRQLGSDIGRDLIGELTSTSPGPLSTTSAERQRQRIVQALALGSQHESVLEEEENRGRGALRLRQGAAGLMASLSSCRRLSNCLAQLPEELRRDVSARIVELLPAHLPQSLCLTDNRAWSDAPFELRRAMRAGVRSLLRLHADAPSLRVAADASAEALLGLLCVLEVLSPWGAAPSPSWARRRGRPGLPDLAPAFINAARVMFAIVVMEIVWFATAWPDGGTATAYAAIGVILFSPKGLQAYAGATTFLIGSSVGVALAGLVRFAVLPACTEFWELCAARSLVLAPLGALSLLPVRGPLFAFAAVNFGVGLSVSNVMSFDTVQFYNQLLAIAMGSLAASLAMLLVRPLSANVQLNRALRRVAGDVLLVSGGSQGLGLKEFTDRFYRIFEALPPQFEHGLTHKLVAIFSFGEEIFRLRRLARRFGIVTRDHDHALDVLELQLNATGLRELDEIEAALSGSPKSDTALASTQMRLRGCIFLVVGLLKSFERQRSPEAAA